eukprot:TRINITY_DN687_c0_g1_i4.p1 TRINITY_DN687_c0_g1~~TRINITY_DN687_c0_g1_i4.p1  ORF type:complete len:576 (-),score=174.02 TRINITY_DN687_c0_g1_i4:1507-3234(-)
MGDDHHSHRAVLASLVPRISVLTAGILIELTIILLYVWFVDYGEETVGFLQNGALNSITRIYPFFQDVHVMVFIGFGFLMTFVYTNSWNAVGLTFLVGAFAIQTSILIGGFWHCVMEARWKVIQLNVETMVAADFAAATVLVSYGALLGKISPAGLLVMVPLELLFYALNESIAVVHYRIADIGGSMIIHTFGAYFGLAASWVATRQKPLAAANPASNKYTDVFAMIGTLFLWLYWPSFNGALGFGNTQHRVIVNTVLSLTGSCLAAFLWSKALRPHRKFSMVDVQNATLAGGVAIGAVADLTVRAWGATTIGFASGSLSTVGFVFLQPLLEHKLRLHDTCGIHNLHGMPGVIGGIAGIVMASFADTAYARYGALVGDIYPAMAGPNGRTGGEQALYQFLTLVTTLGLALVGGAVTGLVLRLPYMYRAEKYFDDDALWLDEEVEVQEHGVQWARAGDRHKDPEMLADQAAMQIAGRNRVSDQVAGEGGVLAVAHAGHPHEMPAGKSVPMATAFSSIPGSTGALLPHGSTSSSMLPYPMSPSMSPLAGVGSHGVPMVPTSQSSQPSQHPLAGPWVA